MKKLIPSILPIFSSAVAMAAGFDVTEGGTHSITGGDYDYIKYDVSATLEQTNLVSVKKDGIIVGGTTDAKVDAVYNAYTGSNKYILVGSSVTESGAAVISGNGKDVSSFYFTGYHLSAYRKNNDSVGMFNIKDITLDYDGSYDNSGSGKPVGGYFRAGVFNITDSVVNFHAGQLHVARNNTDMGITDDVASITLKNSILNFDGTGYISYSSATTNKNALLDNSSLIVASTASNIRFYKTNFELKNNSVLDIQKKVEFGGGNISLDNSSLVLSTTATSTQFGGSNVTLKNNSVLDLQANNVNFGGENGAGTGIISLESGSTFNMTGLSAVSIIEVKVNDGKVHIGENAILNAAMKTVKDAKFTGDGSIAFTNRGTPTTTFDGNVYINVASMNLHNVLAANTFKTLHIGVDENGAKKQVDLSVNASIQMNNGNFVLDGNSTVSTVSNFNWANTKTSLKSIIAEGSTVNVGGSSRINVADIAGTINVDASTTTVNYGWNYALAFGVLYTMDADAKNVLVQKIDGNTIQRGNVNILSTAEINVNLNDTYTGENGNFTILGNITSNAGEGKIKSGQYSKFLIRSNIWNSSEQTVLTLNSTDAFAVGGAESQAESTFYLDNSANVKLVINKENNIGAIDFADYHFVENSTVEFGDTKLALELNDTLTVGQFTGVITLILQDTVLEGTLRITDMDEILSDYASNGSASSFYIKDESGNDRVLNENLFIKDLGDGSYSIYTQVPEPAEWAVVLGALAIAFAFMRRQTKK